MMPHFEFLRELRGHGLLLQSEVKRLNRKGRKERAAKVAKKFKVSTTESPVTGQSSPSSGNRHQATRDFNLQYVWYPTVLGVLRKIEHNPPLCCDDWKIVSANCVPRL